MPPCRSILLSPKLITFTFILLIGQIAATAPFVTSINRMSSRPGTTIGPKGGNAPGGSHGGGMAFLKTGGFISQVGRDNGASPVGQWAVPTGGDFIRIFINGESYVAIKANGEIACWGSAVRFGHTRCPDNQVIAVADYPKPFKYIYSGTSQFCALYADTTVFCWKDGVLNANPPGTGWLTLTMMNGNSYCAINQDGTIFISGITSQAPGAGFFTVAVVATNNHFIATSDDGSLAILGPPAPPVPSGSGYTGIRPGYASFSALKADGSVTCWAIDTRHIVGCPTDTGYVAITATGRNTAYAGLKEDGTVSVWGDVHRGGTLPASVLPLNGIVRVYSNCDAFVAIKEDGSLVCWGYVTRGGGGTGQFDGITECPTGTGFTHVYASYYGFAALASDGAIFTWVIDLTAP